MAVFIFIAKLVMVSGCLYAYYHWFLRNKRFHHYNRFYLLLVSILSFVVPFINIPVSFFGADRSQSMLIRTLSVVAVDHWEEPVTIYANANALSRWFNLQNALYFIYLAGFMTGATLLVRSLAYIRRLRKNNPFEAVNELKIYKTAAPGTPFSFFKSIFWDKTVPLHDARGEQVFRHELFHVKQRHSADILLMEIVCCIAWFNPFFHLIKKELRAIHEFLADEFAISGRNPYDYAELLLLHAAQQPAPSITHPFFHNQIKRRITMITQSNLRRGGYLSRVMALPLVFILASSFAVKLTAKTPATSNDKHTGKMLTVVIDPGHGGIYNGTTIDSKVYEKDITLEIAQKIKLFSGEYNVSIILTRENDNLVGHATSLREDLLNRANIANESKSDLLISIHVNADDRKKTGLSGFEAWVSGRNEQPKNRVIASALLDGIKDIYTVNDTIRQKDVGIVVLDKTGCPSVLLECGYLNNPSDRAFITDKDNQEKIARKILEGIVKYANAPANLISAASAEASTSGNTEAKGENGTNKELVSIQVPRSISAGELSKLHVGDIATINADMKTDKGTVYLKNGTTRTFSVKEINDYYAAHHIEGNLKGYQANVEMKDSVVNLRFIKDTVPGTDKIFTKVESEAEFPGGPGSWGKYLMAHLTYPETAVKKNIQGTVIVQFIVDQRGKLSDVKAISGPKELQEASVKVIKESGTWTSALQDGKKVKAYKKQPIIYKLASS